MPYLKRQRQTDTLRLHPLTPQKPFHLGQSSSSDPLWDMMQVIVFFFCLLPLLARLLQVQPRRSPDSCTSTKRNPTERPARRLGHGLLHRPTTASNYIHRLRLPYQKQQRQVMLLSGTAGEAQWQQGHRQQHSVTSVEMLS